MSSVRKLDKEKLRTRKIIATATLTVFTIAFLLLKGTSAQDSATLLAAESSVQTADKQIPSDPAEPGQTPAGQASREPATLYQNPADQTSASAMPVRPQEE
jgi:hypothetical protein